MPADTDVVIIGAGASGLSAARELNNLGISFTVLEGSHRIGGRAYSEEIAPNVWFDLGCSYLHQGDSNPFVEIAEDLGVVIGKDKGDIFDDQAIGLYKNGAALSPNEREAYDAYHAECYKAIEASVERGEDVAVADLVNLKSEYALPFMHNMAEECAGDIDEISAADVAAWYSGPDIPVLNGYGNLVATWGADVPVTLNTKVERIDLTGKEPVVETSKGKHRAKAILCTVSTGILAANDIKFVPELPDWKVDAISGLPIGIENKVCVHFDKDVFGPGARGFHNTWNDNDEAGGFEASAMGLNTAVVFSGGRLAIWLEKQGTEACYEYALGRVAEAFGNDIRKHVTRMIATAWKTDPWTRGSYSCALPGQAHQRVELARAIEDRLFFAGEATTVGDHACCHGAYRSGIRAAREIAKIL
jgi:monoamine oxidase